MFPVHMIKSWPVFWRCECGWETTDDPFAKMRCCDECEQLMVQENNDIRWLEKYGGVEMKNFGDVA